MTRHAGDFALSLCASAVAFLLSLPMSPRSSSDSLAGHSALAPASQKFSQSCCCKTLCSVYREKTASSKPWVSRVETESRESRASLDPGMSHQPAIHSGALRAGEGRKSKAQRKCFLWFTHHSLPRILQGPYQGWEPVPPMHGHRSCTPSCFIFPSHDDATIVSFLSSLIPEAPVPGHGRGARGTGLVVAFPDSRSQAMGTAAMTLI